MLDVIYRIGRLFTSSGWIIGLLLIALTIGLGTQGFLASNPDQGFSDALYKAISLLAIQTGAVPVEGIWQLEVARWLGMLFWASALLTIAIRLFREPVHRLLVKLFAKNHVLLAGLGQQGVRLVEGLQKRGRTVVVLERDRNHPGVDQCRRFGAIVLFGELSDVNTLLAANLSRASALLVLFPDESECVRIITSAYSILGAETPTANNPPVRSVLRLIEPGLLDLMRQHQIKSDASDRMQLEILNSHEIAATTMVREAVTNSKQGCLNKILVLGLGTYHRLGEMVVVRAAKDHLISRRHCGTGSGAKLIIHVFDQHSEEWIHTVLSRYPFLEEAAEIKAFPCWARKIGAKGIPNRDYDAAFVCIPDEGPATAQAILLRREVLRANQPIMVRVAYSGSGYGSLIATQTPGWGDNIHPVGLEDSLLDPETATRPEIQMRAQTIHHDYRRIKRQELLAAQTDEEREAIQNQSANRPWQRLSEEDREQNRQLAEKYDEYLGMILPGKQIPYRLWFNPIGFENPRLRSGMPMEELEALAEVEHNRWLASKRQQGFTLGNDRGQRQNPYLKEWVELTPAEKEFAAHFVRNMPRILALADYAIIEDFHGVSPYRDT